MTSSPDRVTVIRGDYTIGPSDAWTNAAASWPVFVDSRETESQVWRANLEGTRQTEGTLTESHLRCMACGQSVLCLSPDTRADSYVTSVKDMQAGILSHLRRSHPDVVTS